MSAKLTQARRARMLELVEADKTIGTVVAARKAGVKGTGGEIHKLIEADEEFAEQLRVARGYGRQQIRAEFARRAIEGVERPIFHEGKIVGYTRDFSDRLLVYLAKAHCPEFRELQRFEVTGDGGGPVRITHERRLTLDDVGEFVRSLDGRGDGARGELPTARELLAEPREG